MSHEEGGDKPPRSRVLLALDRMIESVKEDMDTEDPGNHATIGMLSGELKGLMAARTYTEMDASRSSVVANEGETPRTDEWERNCEFKSVGPGRVDFADPYHALLKFARQLGRELAIANERNDELSRQWSESDQCRAIMQALDGQTSPSATVTPEHLAFYKREELRYAVLRRWLVDEDYCIKGMPQAGTREDVDRLCDAEIAKAEAKRCEYVPGGK